MMTYLWRISGLRFYAPAVNRRKSQSENADIERHGNEWRNKFTEKERKVDSAEQKNVDR